MNVSCCQMWYLLISLPLVSSHMIPVSLSSARITAGHHTSSIVSTGPHKTSILIIGQYNLYNYYMSIWNWFGLVSNSCVLRPLCLYNDYQFTTTSEYTTGMITTGRYATGTVTTSRYPINRWVYKQYGLLASTILPVWVRSAHTILVFISAASTICMIIPLSIFHLSSLLSTGQYHHLSIIGRYHHHYWDGHHRPTQDRYPSSAICIIITNQYATDPVW